MSDLSISPAPSGNSGAPISNPSTAYIRTDGNDVTGDGSINKPFATAQAAYDSNFHIFDLGVGNFGTVNVVPFRTIFFVKGPGANNWPSGPASSIGSALSGAISSAPVSQITFSNTTTTDHVHVFSDKTVHINFTGSIADGLEFQAFDAFVGEVNLAGSNGAAGSAGADGVAVGEAGSSGSAGGDGGPGGTFAAYNSFVIGPVTLKGGTGGDGGAGGNGAAGDSGTTGGNGGDGGANGTGGVAGSLISFWSVIACVPDLSPGHGGSGGVGGAGGADNGNGGGSNGTTQSDLSNSWGAAGTARMELSRLDDVPSYSPSPIPPTSTVIGSIINGVFTAA